MLNYYFLKKIDLIIKNKKIQEILNEIKIKSHSNSKFECLKLTIFKKNVNTVISESFWPHGVYWNKLKNWIIIFLKIMKFSLNLIFIDIGIQI